MSKSEKEMIKVEISGNEDCLSRRQFLKATGAVVAMGMINGVGVFNHPLFASGFDEYLKFDALGLAELVRKKQVKPEELLESAITRIEAINPKINAVVTKMYDEARKSISMGLPDGPFKGVPFLLKDIGATYAGVRLTAGSKLFANNVPKNDSELVKRYKQAGLVTMGKTNTPEFGLVPTTEPVFLGPARNPWNLEHSTGGSSGGAAAAVAARITPIAHGGDGGGSIRIPSSCCGVFGMKPTRGRIPMGPGAGEAWEGFVVMHTISLSVRDSAAMLDATSAPDIGAPYGIPAPERPFLKEIETDPGNLKIAYFSKAGSWQTHPDCVDAAVDAAKLCESMGHKVETASPGIDYEPLIKAFKLIVAGHLAATFDQVGHLTGKKVTADMVEPLTWELAQIGWKASAADFAGSKAIINKTTRKVAAFFNKFDVILTPTLTSPPVKLGEFDTVKASFEDLLQRLFRYCCFTFPYNITGIPAMSVPLYWNSNGLPIGIQFAGRYAGESTLYRLAGQLEKARPWSDRKPPISV